MKGGRQGLDLEASWKELLFLNIYLVYFWLHWVFAAMRWLSVVALHGLILVLLLQSTDSRAHRLQ